MVPPLPTNHASFAALPQTSVKLLFTTKLTADSVQVVPSQWMTSPPYPTAQTSVTLVPQTLARSWRRLVEPSPQTDHEAEDASGTGPSKATPSLPASPPPPPPRSEEHTSE